MGFFDNFKISFGFGGRKRHHNETMNNQPGNKHYYKHNHNHNLSPNHHQLEIVSEGRGVFAWIEKSGMFFSGDIPGVSGIMRVNMEHSFEQCLNKLTANINNSISTSFSSFSQDVTYNEIAEKHPEAKIVFIPIYKK